MTVGAPVASSPNDEIRFRRAVEHDLPTIIRLLADDPLGVKRESPDGPLPASYCRAFAAIIADSNNELVVVEDATQRVIGVLQLTFIPYLTHRGGWRAQIEGVRIAVEHRSRGIGQRFFAWAIQQAKSRECHMVQLTTDKRRPEAMRFYESLGFVASHEGMKMSLRSPDAGTE